MQAARAQGDDRNIRNATTCRHHMLANRATWWLHDRHTQAMNIANFAGRTNRRRGRAIIPRQRAQTGRGRWAPIGDATACSRDQMFAGRAIRRLHEWHANTINVAHVAGRTNRRRGRAIIPRQRAQTGRGRWRAIDRTQQTGVRRRGWAIDRALQAVRRDTGLAGEGINAIADFMFAGRAADILGDNAAIDDRAGLTTDPAMTGALRI